MRGDGGVVTRWQIISGVRHGHTAALAVSFKQRDTELFAIISGFDAAYSAYNDFQSGIERYWTLKYLQQNGITELTATFFKDNLVRADDLPLVLPAAGAQGLPRGARVRVKLGEIDEITLDIHSTVIERLDTEPADAATAADEDLDAEDAEDAELTAGPISIAVDLSETDSDAANSPASAPAA